MPISRQLALHAYVSNIFSMCTCIDYLNNIYWGLFFTYTGENTLIDKNDKKYKKTYALLHGPKF